MSSPLLLEFEDKSLEMTFTMTGATLHDRMLEFQYTLAPGYTLEQFEDVHVKRGMPQLEVPDGSRLNAS